MGFRNVLVHEYVRVDDVVVVARLVDLTELQDFVDQAGRWVTTG